MNWTWELFAKCGVFAADFGFKGTIVGFVCVVVGGIMEYVDRIKDDDKRLLDWPMIARAGLFVGKFSATVLFGGVAIVLFDFMFAMLFGLIGR